MYSQPQVYGDKPFQSSYLPPCMYSVAPYYQAELDTESNAPANMASILPLPLLPTDINLNDANIKNTLDDVLSRQMLLLCRLNQLEQQLLSRHKVLINETPALESPKVPGSLSEDIVVHFNLDSIPYSHFALLASLRKSSPVLVNLYMHSSVAGQPSVNIRVAELKRTLASTINFTFSSPEQYLTRAQYPMIVTFIVTSVTSSPRATFQAGQNLVEGELAIAQNLLQLLKANPQGAESIWSLLTNPAVLSSDKAILEQLGPQVFNLSESQYLLKQSAPGLLDVILWSLTVPEFTRPTRSVASSLRGSQLLNSKWAAAIHQFVSN